MIMLWMVSNGLKTPWEIEPVLLPGRYHLPYLTRQSLA